VSHSAAGGGDRPARYNGAMTRPQIPEYRLLNDEEIAIWEAAGRGTDDTNEAWRELKQKLDAEVERERAIEAATTCTACGQRCNSMSWHTYVGAPSERVSRCCHAPLPPEPA